VQITPHSTPLTPTTSRSALLLQHVLLGAQENFSPAVQAAMAGAATTRDLLFERSPYVCPEPILAKCSFKHQKRSDVGIKKVLFGT